MKRERKKLTMSQSVVMLFAFCHPRFLKPSTTAVLLRGAETFAYKTRNASVSYHTFRLPVSPCAHETPQHTLSFLKKTIAVPPVLQANCNTFPPLYLDTFDPLLSLCFLTFPPPSLPLLGILGEPE